MPPNGSNTTFVYNSQDGFMLKHKTGFSLIELMIAVAIIGLLAAIAVPSYQSYVAKAHFAEIFSAAGQHSHYAKNRRVTKKNFKGAGRCVADHAHWDSETCKNEYGRDRPSDEEEADHLLKTFRQALRKLLQEA